MRIKIEAGNAWYAVEVPLQDLAQEIAAYWLKARESGNINVDRRVHEPHFHLPLVDRRSTSKRHPGSFHIGDPIITVREVDGRWMFVTWHYQYSQIGDGDEDGCLFCFRENLGQPFRLFQLPPTVKVEMDGTLVFTIVTDVYRFPAEQKPWPWPLHNLGPYIPIGVLNQLLFPSDVNPLTMLIRSSNPYKGLGLMIADNLKWAQRQLIVNLSSGGMRE